MDVVVLGPAGDRGSMLELTTRLTPEEARGVATAAADAGGGDGGGAGITGTAALATLSEGDDVDGVVTAVSADTLAVSVAPGLTVRIPRVETAETAGRGRYVHSPHTIKALHSSVSKASLTAQCAIVHTPPRLHHS